MPKSTVLLFVLITSATSAFAWSIPGLSKTTDTAAETAEKAPQTAAEISDSLSDSIAEAKASMGGDDPQMNALLDNIQKQANSGEDLSMVQSLSGLSGLPDASSLTNEQQELLTEVKGHAQALALKRQFSNDPDLAGPVTDAVNAVQTKDTTKAVSSLKAIADKGTLSDSQQQLLKSMLGDYGSYLDTASKASDTVDSIKSLF